MGVGSNPTSDTNVVVLLAVSGGYVNTLPYARLLLESCQGCGSTVTYLCPAVYAGEAWSPGDTNTPKAQAGGPLTWAIYTGHSSASPSKARCIYLGDFSSPGHTSCRWNRQSKSRGRMVFPGLTWLGWLNCSKLLNCAVIDSAGNRESQEDH